MQPENRNLPAPLPTEPGVLTMTSCGPVAFCLEKIRGWTPAEPLPTGLTVETVSMAITALSDAAKPASPQQMAVLVGHIRHFGQLFGLIQFSEDDAEAVWTIYRQDLDDLPFAVLIEAFARLRRSWRWKSLPKPGDIRAEAEKLMEGWTTARLRLETAARKLRQSAAQAPETKAQADARRAAPHRRPSRGCRRPLARDNRRREGLPLAPDGVGRP